MSAFLDEFVGRELRGQSSLSVDGSGIHVSIGGLSRVLRAPCPHPEEDLSRFVFWAVRPSSNPESAIREIKDRASGGRTLGYVFPINGLSPSSEFAADKLSGRFAPIFASVVVLAIAQEGVARSVVRRKFTDVPDELDLRDALSPDIAMVVLGRENLNAAGLDEAHARLMVQEAGYFRADLPPEYVWTRPDPDFSRSGLSLGRISGDLAGHCELFERLVALAVEQKSAVAALLVYYQVVEVLSERVLMKRLGRIAATQFRTSWDLKEALQKASSEVDRVTAICQQASREADVSVFEGLLRIGQQISALSTSRNSGLNVDGDLGPGEATSGAPSPVSPGAALYRVRNLVVHNQASLSPDTHELLNNFVVALHFSVFAMLRRFRDDEF